MKTRLGILAILAICLSLLLAACGGGGNQEKTASPTGTQQSTGGNATPVPGGSTDDLLQAEKFFANPPDFTVDLSENTLEEPAFPSADINIPDANPGPIDVNLNIDSNIDVSIPAISAPSTSGLISGAGVSVPSMPTTAPTGTNTPAATSGATQTPAATATIPGSASCSMFSSVPSCSYVPEQFRELCEQCKAGGQ